MENNLLKRIVGMACLLLLLVAPAKAQFTYGTTGLLHMPTADMQRDKTFMFGGSFLNEHATPARFNFNTYNYYINITFFPWLEVGYTCNLFTAKSLGLDKHGYSGFTNQDRNFSGRLRLWKEGWWKEWTPQVVVGGNDVLHGSAYGGDIGAVEGAGIRGNTYFQRYYIAATKHIDWYGKWGVHAAYVYSKRIGHAFNGLALGVDYTFALPETSTLNKAVNKLNLMAEYDSKFVNVGAKYACWKDYVNVVAELRECRYPSVGVYFKVHLK
ncbi:MAG: YjbH domain-containing protein [Bacteroides sp.]|nr:YjbH domain-containing protein [Bacteroides sp.]